MSHTLTGTGAVVRSDHSISTLACLLTPERGSGAWYPAELDRGGIFRSDGFVIWTTPPPSLPHSFEVLSVEVLLDEKRRIDFRRLEHVPPPTIFHRETPYEIWVPVSPTPPGTGAGALEPGKYRITIHYRRGDAHLEATWNCTYEERKSGAWTMPRIPEC